MSSYPSILHQIVPAMAISGKLKSATNGLEKRVQSEKLNIPRGIDS